LEPFTLILNSFTLSVIIVTAFHGGRETCFVASVTIRS